MKKLDVFYISIDDSDESGMDAISLVKEGAVQSNFLCFEEQKSVQLNFYQEDKRLITGVVARADYPIYRRNGDYEYYVVFTKEVIEKMVKKYAKQGLFNSVNFDHNNYAFVKDAYMVESFMIDRENGINPSQFSEIEDHSWICTFWIEDEMLWNEIKNNDNFNAFSLQGLFHLIPKTEETKMEKQETFEEWLDEIIKEYTIKI